MLSNNYPALGLLLFIIAGLNCAIHDIDYEIAFKLDNTLVSIIIKLVTSNRLDYTYVNIISPSDYAPNVHKE